MGIDFLTNLLAELVLLKQNLTGRRIAILVLTTTSWPRIRQFTSEIQCAVAVIREGYYHELSVP